MLLLQDKLKGKRRDTCSIRIWENVSLASKLELLEEIQVQGKDRLNVINEQLDSKLDVLENNVVYLVPGIEQ